MEIDDMEEEKQKFDHMFRILLIGDTGKNSTNKLISWFLTILAVGKSALLLRFTEGTFEDTFIATIGYLFCYNFLAFFS